MFTVALYGTMYRDNTQGGSCSLKGKAVLIITCVTGGKYLLGEITIYDLPGNHMHLHEEPYIHLWAEKLKTCLNETQGAKVTGSKNRQNYPGNRAVKLA